MKTPFEKLSPFRVDSQKIMDTFGITDGDFDKATEEEKEAMVEIHRGVSYLRDAIRRFRSNWVSMTALIVFILCLLFAFVGPFLIPYNYADQFRTSQKLGPFEYSEYELSLKAIERKHDAFYATFMHPGSITALEPGEYCLKAGRKTYGFTLYSSVDNAIITLDKNDAEPLKLIRVSDVNADGSLSDYTALETDETPAKDATVLQASKRVFPHVFGTDSAGRDIMARTMYGARVSIVLGIAAAFVVLIIGSLYGAIAGLSGGAVDFVMMRFVELIYAIPEVLIVLLLQVVLKEPLQNWFRSHTDASSFVRTLSDLGTGIISILITFAALYWVTMARIIRGQVLQLKKQDFVVAANALGASNARIIHKHLMPNCIGPLVITTCMQIPSAIFLESFLSFLGLGVSAPMTSLGSLCSDALQTVQLYPYRLVFPAVILTVIVLTLNLVGDGLRDAFDPRLKK